MEATPDADTWADALNLFAQRYSVVVVGPRRHEDWELDVGALLRRQTTDPRSWKTREFYEEDEEEWRSDRIAPLVPPGPGEWRSKLREIPHAHVERLLVAISTNWLDVTKELDFEVRRPALEAKAEVLLCRFDSPTTVFYTNGWYGEGEEPDFYSSLRGCDPVSEHDWDVGLLAVSEHEVGLFWSFDAS